jgi:hypothetical protein
MLFFTRAATPEEIRGHKKIVVNGMRFVIRKLNPLLDFPDGRVPQIFTAYVSRRPAPATPPETTDAEVKRAREEMCAIILAGVVEPRLAAEDAKEGIKATDLFRDPSLGIKLYFEVMAHSLNVFKGIKGQFFFLRIKLWLWMRWLKDMGVRRRMSLSPTEG